MNLVDELYAITTALNDGGIAYAICGGVAVTIHGATRSTKDIDLLIAPQDLPKALELIRPLGYLFPAFPMIFDEKTARERHVQRVSKVVGTEHLIVDFLVATASLAGLMEGSVEVSPPRGRLRVVSKTVLLHMKRLAGRTQDLADIEKLEQIEP